ncbi:MAG: hypothetical protein ABI923_03435 [bacterium]
MRLRFVLGGLTILLAVGLSSCSVVSKIRANNRRVNEPVLQDRLDSFRLGLRQYAAARKELPQSLAEFRSSGYGHTFEDPITGKDDWQVDIGEDPQLIKGKRGVINFHSSSTAISSRGTPYNTW